MNVACNTTYTPATSAFLTATVADGWNSLDTIITLACSSRANSGYFNESRMILDGSYKQILEEELVVHISIGSLLMVLVIG